MKAKIKICGITNLADGQLALELGADLLGFNFYPPSPRYIDPKKAADIIAKLPRDTISVGLFVNAGTDAIAKVLQQCPVKIAQLHGDESNDDCKAAQQLGVEVIKALRIGKKEDINLIDKFDPQMILLDAFRQELYGGTGHTFDWNWIKSAGGKNIFLAGGINPDNITDALAVGTYGIDLCSGVEKEPGIKDVGKMKLLFKKIAII